MPRRAAYLGAPTTPGAARYLVTFLDPDFNPHEDGDLCWSEEHDWEADAVESIARFLKARMPANSGENRQFLFLAAGITQAAVAEMRDPDWMEHVPDDLK